MNGWFAIIVSILLVTLLVLIGTELAKIPPEQSLKVCDKSHKEDYTSIVPIYSGNANGIPLYTYIPVQNTKTVCDEFHFVDNPKYLKWHEKYGNGTK